MPYLISTIGDKLEFDPFKASLLFSTNKYTGVLNLKFEHDLSIKRSLALMREGDIKVIGSVQEIIDGDYLFFMIARDQAVNTSLIESMTMTNSTHSFITIRSKGLQMDLKVSRRNSKPCLQMCKSIQIPVHLDSKMRLQ